MTADFLAWVIHPWNKVNCKKLASYSFLYVVRISGMENKRDTENLKKN